VVIGPARDHRPILGHNAADRQAGSRVEHRPTDAGFVQEFYPIVRCRVARAAAVLLEIAEVQMVELWKKLRHLISFGHVLGDFLAASVVVDVSVSVDKLHGLTSFYYFCGDRSSLEESRMSSQG